MKFARLISLTAVMATAMVAVLGASSAYAAETTLCGNGVVSPYCPSGQAHPKGTILKSSSANFFLENSLTTFVECETSALSAEITAESGEPLPVSIPEWTFNGCHTKSGVPCTVENYTGSPIAASVSRTNGWEGSLDLSGGAGGGEFHATCKKILNCTWALPDLEIEGGASADLNANSVTLTKTGGAFCPEKATLTASYGVSSPSHVFVATPGSPPAKTTGVCIELEYWCEPQNLYPSGTTLKGTASNVVFDNNSGYGFGDLTCEEGVITAKTTAAYGEPLGVENTQFDMINCTFGNGSACTVKAVSNYSGAIERNNADGLWKGGAVLSMTCGKYLVCTLTAPSGSTITIEHGEPGAFRLKNLGLEVSGSMCPTSTSVTATFPLVTPTSSIFFTDVLR